MGILAQRLVLVKSAYQESWRNLAQGKGFFLSLRVAENDLLGVQVQEALLQQKLDTELTSLSILSDYDGGIRKPHACKLPPRGE